MTRVAATLALAVALLAASATRAVRIDPPSICLGPPQAGFGWPFPYLVRSQGSVECAPSIHLSVAGLALDVLIYLAVAAVVVVAAERMWKRARARS